MKTSVLLAMLIGMMISGCSKDFWTMCDPGEMRCSGGASQMCDEHKSWEDFQDCRSVGTECTTSSSRCSGFSDIACCD